MISEFLNLPWSKIFLLFGIFYIVILIAPGIENCPISKNSHLKSDGWNHLFGGKEEQEMTALKENLTYTLERVSRTLHGII